MTRFRRYLGRRVPFSCLALLDSFLAVPRASGAGSLCHVLRSRNHFRRYRGRQIPLSCIALPDLFTAVPRASGPFFLFCAPAIVFGGTEGVGSRFHVLFSRTRFRRCRVRQGPFSCFACPESFSTVPSASCPVFMFCAPRLFFDGTKAVRSRFHVLCSQTRFLR
jgi:hypothetical protein